VIFADANLERAARAAAAGIFFNAGQVCSAGSRVSVERAAYDEVIDRLVEHARR
jgi:aldehyde dehydrogenase (NAD+)